MPGILEWPSRIAQNVQTWHPVYVNDYMPTFLHLVGMPHPQPTWAADGMSLLPLIVSLGAPQAAAGGTKPLPPHPRRPTAHPLVFELGGQAALIDNDMKILLNPGAGHCNKANGSYGHGDMLLFNLSTDASESMVSACANLSACLSHQSIN